MGLTREQRERIMAAGGAALGVALITALIAVIEAIAPIGNLSVLYLLPVMFCAVTWDWWSSLGAAVVAFLAYNFCFVEPRYTFAMHDAHEWASLLVFLVVAAVTSNLAARERARREQANRQARTATLLYEIGRALGGDDLNRSLRDVADQLVREFRLAGAVIAVSEPNGRLTPRAVAGRTDSAIGSVVSGRVFQTSHHGGRAGRWIVVRGDGRGGGSMGRGPITNFPLRRQDHDLGMLRLVGRRDGFADDEARLLATIADLVAVALDRDALRQEANRVEVLGRTDELRTALLNSVSHDLRTPLAAIKASAESLLQKDVAWTDEDRDGFAAAIDREADRLDRLVANLLDMSLIEGGALRPRLDWYDVGELVREVVARLGPLLDGRSIMSAIEDDLPPVSLDYLMIDQVVTNILENVAKHTPPGSPIRVAVEATPRSVRVAVEDRGPGIPADRRVRVFDKFYRLGTASGVRGSGLGLAVSRGLVEAHGGCMVVEAGNGPPDRPGARFVFELPCDDLSVGSRTRAGARAAQTTPAGGAMSADPGSGGRR